MTFNGPIGDLIKFSIGGGWGSDAERSGYSEVAIIRGTDIPKVAMGDVSTVPRRFESSKKLINRLLKSGDIVLETAGGSSAKGQFTGRTLLVSDDMLQSLGPTICASFCKRLELNTALVEPGYFYWYMQDLYNSGRVAVYDSQSTGISNFQFSSFLESEFLNLPDLATQRAIAISLSSVNSLIKSNLETAQLLEEIAQTIFKSWFVDFDPVKAKMAGEKPVGMDDATAALFPDLMQDSELGPIPVGWSVSTLKEFAPFVYGKALKADLRQEGTVPVYGSNGVVGVHNDSLTNSSAVIIGRKGTVGTVNLCLQPAWIIDTGYFSIPVDASDVYLTYFSLKTLGLEKMNSDAAVPGLNRDEAHRQKILVGDAAIRKRFSEVVGLLFAQVSSLQEQSKLLFETRDRLLPRLISGELQISEEMMVES